MRKIYLYLFSFLVFFSCQEDSIDIPGFATEAEAVSFYVPSSGILSITESDGIHELVVNRTLVSDAAVTVNFSIEMIGATTADLDFISERGTVQIPSNQASGVIIFETFNNNLGGEADKIVRLTITDVSSGVIPDDSRGRNTSVDIVLVDDDCPVDAAAFQGVYTVTEVFSEGGINAGLTLGGVFGQSYQLEISPEPGDATNTRLVINNSPGFNEYLPDGTALTLDACTGTVVFDNGAPSVALFANMAIETAVFDDTNFTIQAFGPLGNFGPYEFLFERQ